MYNAEFFGSFDVTALVLTLFVLFFLGLMIYLRREDRREGYPIEDDVTGRPEPGQGFFFVAQPKTFHLPHGAGDVSKPDGVVDSLEMAATRRSRVSGTPLQPVGDPMFAGVGPGAFANRARTPDLTDHGALKVVPLRDAPDFRVDTRDPDPRGMVVLGADRQPAGVVCDLWVDRGEIMIRYLEVELAADEAQAVRTAPEVVEVVEVAPVALAVVEAPGEAPQVVSVVEVEVVAVAVDGDAGARGLPGARRVLLPMTMATVSRRTGTVSVSAINARQFAGVPALAQPDRVTRDEEERVCAYYGGGYLYATPARVEPLL